MHKEVGALRAETATLGVWGRVARAMRTGQPLAVAGFENAPALCARVLARDLEDRGDAPLHEAAGEVHCPKPSLGRVAEQLRALGENDPRPPAALPAEEAATA